jgi:hypothetical protein
MANEINIHKTVLKKDEFDRVVDTSFSTFVDPVAEVNNDTVEELFRLYDKLYYEIPIEGTTQSHTYLVQKSSKLVNLEKDLTDVQPLLDEISELRERLLVINQEKIEIQTQAITDAANNV